jgi:toxin ParE1/3/4
MTPQSSITRRQSQGLDLRFIVSVENTIQLILEDPVRWRVFEGDVRRCLTYRFPYAILYSIEPGYILIIAVAHCSREPGYWKRRIEP